MRSDPVPNNLPVESSSFVGREQEMGEIARLLGESRLVTLTGAGGCGKTRLALRVAANLCKTTETDQAFTDGIWSVELASLVDPALVVQKVASTLDVRESAARPLLFALEDRLREKHLLLILDNCEHVIDACARLADPLLHASADLHILATSREPLNIEGETTYLVPSLPAPPPGAPPDSVQLERYDAVRLFLERARAAQPHFVVNSQHAGHVAEICRRLDGIPLAIELAAARLKTMPVEQIAQRLDDRFHLLTGGSRTALPRHRTLGALVDWSYDLLGMQEQQILRRVAVFAGGWTLDAAESVCTDGAHGSFDVLDLLTHLVDKSMVTLDEQATEPRYRMLETFRQYARQKLEASGESVAVRTRHLDFFVRMAEEAELKLESSEQVTWLNRLEMEHDNLRAAITWALESHQADAGLRLSGALVWFWLVRGSPSEACERIAELLALPGAAGKTAVRAKALSTAGQLQAIRGQNAIARSLSEEALRLEHEAGGQRSVALALENLGTASSDEGDDEAARHYFERSAVIRRATGDRFNLGAVLAILGELAFRKGRLSEAQALLNESLSTLRAVGERFVLAIPLRLLSHLAVQRGDCRQAMLLGRESLQCNLDIRDRYGAAASLSAVAAVVLAAGKPAQAARLFGAVDALLTSIQVPLYTIDRAAYDRSLAALRAQLGPAGFDEAWIAGHSMTVAEAMAEIEIVATKMEVAESSLPVPPGQLEVLSRRELDVLRWLARGLTNDEIAEQLVISPRTVHAHLRSIYAKLDLTTRTSAVRYALDNKLG